MYSVKRLLNLQLRELERERDLLNEELKGGVQDPLILHRHLMSRETSVQKKQPPPSLSSASFKGRSSQL